MIEAVTYQASKIRFIEVEKLRCHRRMPRLGPQLTVYAELIFVEVFLLAEGSIKEACHVLGVSYPAVRNRLDKVISALREEITRDSKQSPSVTRKEK